MNHIHVKEGPQLPEQPFRAELKRIHLIAKAMQECGQTSIQMPHPIMRRVFIRLLPVDAESLPLLVWEEHHLRKASYDTSSWVISIQGDIVEASSSSTRPDFIEEWELISLPDGNLIIHVLKFLEAQVEASKNPSLPSILRNAFAPLLRRVFGDS